MSHDIRLTLVNRSWDLNRSDVVMFQQDCNGSDAEDPIAWKVIRRCPVEWSHPFLYSQAIQVRVMDARGRHLASTEVEPGCVVRASEDSRFGAQLDARPGDNRESVVIENHCPGSPMRAELLRNSRVFVRSLPFLPGSRVSMRVRDELFVVATSGICEGSPIRRGMLEWRYASRLELPDRAKAATISMLGGGYGGKASPVRFELAYT